jgi:uncharacterized membrane protein YhaH (DUF805 family)
MFAGRPESSNDVVIETLGPSALFSFEGRINRRTFWKITILNLVFGSIATVVGTQGIGDGGMSVFTVSMSTILGGIALWQSLATQAKRWHDLGKSGYFALLTAIPLVNVYAFLRLAFTDGLNEPNQYGEGPVNIRVL